MPDDIRAYLDNMSLSDLAELKAALEALHAAGTQVEDWDFYPRFDLTGLNGMTMTIDHRLPLTRAEWQAATPAPSPDPAFVAEPAADSFDLAVADGYAHVLGTASGPTAADIDRAVNAAADKVLASVWSRADQPAPETAPEAAPAPGSASALVASARAAAWTPEEDARLLSLVVAAVKAGQSQSDAIARAATEIDRPLEGTKFRLRNKLAARLDAALGDVPAPENPAADPAPAAQPVAEPVAEATPAAAPPLSPPLSPIEQHLFNLPRKDGWTMDRDFHLLDLACAGWQMPEIAAEMGLDAGRVLARFNLLTGLNPETKARAWTRSALFEALEPWVKTGAPTPVAAE